MRWLAGGLARCVALTLGMVGVVQLPLAHMFERIVQAALYHNVRHLPLIVWVCARLHVGELTGSCAGRCYRVLPGRCDEAAGGSGCAAAHRVPQCPPPVQPYLRQTRAGTAAFLAWLLCSCREGHRAHMGCLAVGAGSGRGWWSQEVLVRLCLGLQVVLPQGRLHAAQAVGQAGIWQGVLPLHCSHPLRVVH